MWDVDFRLSGNDASRRSPRQTDARGLEWSPAVYSSQQRQRMNDVPLSALSLSLSNARMDEVFTR